MRLTTAIGIYSLTACGLIFAGILAVLEWAAAAGVEEQAHRVTGLLQAEMVQCIDAQMSGVEANVDRTSMAFEVFGNSLRGKELSKALRLMMTGDSTIVGAALAYQPQYAPGGARRWMMYAHRAGSEVMTRQLASSGYNYTDMDWFTAPIASGRPSWSRPYFDHGGGDCLMTTYSQPVSNDTGDIIGVLTADVELGAVIHAMQRLKPYPTSRSFLIDREGRLIGDEDIYGPIGATERNILEHIDLQVDGGHFRDQTFTIDGERYMSNYSNLAGLELIVCTITPYNTVVAVFRNLRLPFLIVILVGLLVLFGGIYSVIRYFSRPLSRLTQAAVEIGKGNFATPLPPAGSLTDIRKLRDGMEHMETSIAQYVSEIENATRKSERIQSELDIAAGIQQSMLPGPWGTGSDGVEISALLESAREVGGDMYDYVRNGDAVYLLVADVSGKGVPAALVMTSVLSLFRSEAGRGSFPSEILAHINRVTCRGNTACMFVTALVARLKGASLEIANAGHNPPLLYSEGHWSVMRLAPALPLGIMDDTEYADTVITFAPDHLLLLYTDGLTEAENAKGEQFGENRLLETLSNAPSTAPGEITQLLRREVAKFAPGGLSDDITIVCMGIEADERRLSLGYSAREISKLADFTRQLGLTDEMTMKVNLVLEEAVANIINHSAPSHPDDKIGITVKKSTDTLRLTITDSGPNFNPLEDAPEVDISQSVEERPVGGLGIFLLRQLASNISYTRDNDHNILTININPI